MEPEITLTPEELVEERSKTHGTYSNTSRYIRAFKNVVSMGEVERRQRGQPRLTDQQRESLDMIMHKAGRILSGDPNEQDHWADIAGYAMLANKEF